MSSYSYVAIDVSGAETRGMVEVADQSEAIRRIKEMGLFPTKVLQEPERKSRPLPAKRPAWIRSKAQYSFPFGVGKVNTIALTMFTRQLATLIEAGLPLLRGLRILHEQEEGHALKSIIGELSLSIENGNSLAEAMSAHPRVFNRLYLNMVKAGEIGGSLEMTLKRLAEFMEKAQKIKGRIKAAMFYPCAVLVVAMAILALLMAFVVPRFKAVFEGLFNGAPLPAFTRFVFDISNAVQHRLIPILIGVTAAALLFSLAARTMWGRWVLDQFKLAAPVLGPLFRKVAISRFARTLATLIGNGVPILQALNIVKETAGNMLFARVIARVHDNVKEGEPMAPTLKESNLFPAMVAGMVDVGEQTGALPEMLSKIADNYDEQVDNAAGALTSLLEPIMIVLLAVIVGSIVIAMFLPIIKAPGLIDGSNTGGGGEN
jgi:type IV pilus assembly protein PilC